MERRAFRVSGFAMLGVLVVLVVIAIAAAAPLDDGPAGVVITVVSLVAVIAFSGLTVVNPNEARVMQFFGRYVGTIADAGFHWTVPLSTKRRLSRRVRNF